MDDAEECGTRRRWHGGSCRTGAGRRGRPARRRPSAASDPAGDGVRAGGPAGAGPRLRARDGAEGAAAAQAHAVPAHRARTAGRGGQPGVGGARPGARGRGRGLRRVCLRPRLPGRAPGGHPDRRARGEPAAGRGQPDRCQVHLLCRGVLPEHAAAWRAADRHPAAPGDSAPGPFPGGGPGRAGRLRPRPRPADAAGIRRFPGGPPAQRRDRLGGRGDHVERGAGPARGRAEERRHGARGAAGAAARALRRPAVPGPHGVGLRGRGHGAVPLRRDDLRGAGRGGPACRLRPAPARQRRAAA